MNHGSIKIRNLDLRDGHQSYFATRMTDEQIERVLSLYLDAGYDGLEVWGGATLDSSMRFLNQDPWERLEKIAKITNSKTNLTALARGINLFGYNPYPDHVVYDFIKLAVESGITIMRVFDALNDLNNLKVTIKAIKESGGKADCAICYTTNPVYTFAKKWKYFIKKREFPKSVFDVDYFVQKAVELEKMGADIITIKDMAGLINPEMSFNLISALKKKIKLPVNLHSHCTPGYAVTSHAAAMIAGVDILDVVSFPFSGGPSHPAVEIIIEYAKKFNIDTGLNEAKLPEIRKVLSEIRTELSQFDEYKNNIVDFSGTFTDEQHSLMNESIKYIKKKKFQPALNCVHKFEASLGLPAPDEPVRLAQIPGGMYSNMLSQLKQMKISHLLQEVLKEVPRVRLDAGLVPLVTPTSQIVGTQAVQNVMLKNRGKEAYSSCSTQYINLVRGEYGQTPVPISSEFRLKITKSKEEKRFDTSKWKHAEAPDGLVKNKKDQMLLDLFPSVALSFFEKREKAKESA
ncbi:MAG: carboxylase [Spirochaetes bacterium]|nr:carboxylase [Spirochaetota bacterium]